MGVLNLTDQELGQILRQTRMALGYKQETVARVLQCSRSTYSYKESGAVRILATDILKLADFYGISPLCLLTPAVPGKTIASKRIRKKGG